MAIGARPIGTRAVGDSTGYAGAISGAPTVNAEAVLAGTSTFTGTVTEIALAAATLTGTSTFTGTATIIDHNTSPVMGNQATFFAPLMRRYYPDFDVDDWPNEVQTITVGGSSLTSFTLTFDGQTTVSLPADASAIDVYLALIGLSNIGDDEVTVTGPDGGPWVVTFINGLGMQDVPDITATPTGGTGTVTPEVTVPGVEPPPWWTPDAVPLGPADETGITVDVIALEDLLPIPTTGAVGKFWQDQIATDGSGGMQVEDTDAVEGETLLRFSLNNHTAFQVLVTEIEDVEVAAGEEHDQWKSLTGPGAIALLARASVAPEFGFPVDESERRTSVGMLTDVRYFNFASRYLDDSHWKPTVYTPPDYNGANLFGRAVGMSDLAAQELWDRPSGVPVPGGDVYFRQWFNDGRDANDKPMIVRVEGAADDEMELWIDNKPVLEITGVYAGGMKYTMIELPPGEHLVAWRGRNRNELRAMTVWSIGTVDSKGRFDDIIAHSDSADAICLGYPSTPPGFPVGQAFRILMLEAQGGTRQEIPYLTTSFGSFYDSNGTPWPVRSDLSCRLDSNLLDVCRAWGESYWDIAMASYGTEFHAWIKGQRGTNVFGEWNTGVEVTSKTKVNKSVPNVAIVRYDTGLVEVRHPSAKPFGAKDPNVISLQMGHIKSATAARREGVSYLESAARRAQNITLTLDVPYTLPQNQVYSGVWVGDSPLVDGERLRVHGINVAEEEDLFTVTPEVISAALTAEERRAVQFIQMSPGSGRGTSRATSPAADLSFPAAREGSEFDLPFSWEEGDADASVVLRAGSTTLATLDPAPGVTESYVLPVAHRISAGTKITVDAGGSEPSMQKTTDKGIWIMEFVVDRDVDPVRGAASVKIA